MKYSNNESKKELFEKLDRLVLQGQDIQKQIQTVEKQLKEREKVLMFMIKKGVPTFAFHNSSQKYNLTQNGWKEVSKESLIKEIEKYD